MDRRALARVALASIWMLLVSCGGGSAAPDAAQPQAVSAARLSQGSSFELPLVRSGTHTFSDVRFTLKPDGTYQLVSATEVQAPEGAVIDAVVTPAQPLAQLRIDSPATLNVRRLHIDERVYDAVSIALAQGHWSYASTPKEAEALSAADFKANPQLEASEKHTLVISSAPGGEQVFPIRLEAKAYRFCADAQEEGGDELALDDSTGRRVMTVRAGQGCVDAALAAGSYKLRHKYGGSGSKRVMFVRPSSAPTRFKAAAQRPAWAPAAAPQDAAAGSSDYWGIAASFGGLQGYLTTGGYTPETPQAWPGSQVLWSGDWFPSPPVWWLQPCFAWHGLQTNAAWGDGSQTATGLLQGMNLFSIGQDANGNYTLGPPLACLGTPQVYGVPNWGNGVWLNNPAGYQSDFFANTFRTPRTENPPVMRGLPSPALGQAFNLVHTDPDIPGQLYWLTFNGTNTLMGGFDAGANGLAVTGDGQAFYPGPLDVVHQYFTLAVRYRPGGVAMSDLQSGQAAFFGYPGCSGPGAIVASRLDKLGNPTLMFDSVNNLGYQQGKYVLVGPDTQLTMYAQAGYTGMSQVVFQPGCQPVNVAMQSLIVAIDSAETVYNAGNTCVNCNLGSVDMSNHDLHGANLSVSNLSRANLAKANLAGADLHQSLLESASLAQANLDGANLCGASLGPAAVDAAGTSIATDLHGAFLRNANLQSADLTRANFAKASFFGSSSSACTAATTCGAGASNCPNAQSATLLETNFADAYLAHADFSSSKGSATFTGAIAPGAYFKDAKLASPTDFTGAFIVGSDFTGAGTAGVTGLDSAIATSKSGTCAFKLDTGYTSFAGYSIVSGTSCAASAAAATCTFVTYPASPVLPPGATVSTSPSNAIGTCGTAVCIPSPVAGNTCFQPVGK
ncbi:MAG TPA: pentapeptide repeat-containing protein [Ramlibacter sp.]|nr:pentapeptide repeat-containing protein [Ramlibacter sp.]